MHQALAVEIQVMRGLNNRRTDKSHSGQGDMFASLAAQTGFVVKSKCRVVARTHAWNEGIGG